MTKTNKKGFTIIEVVLVLAIAGLIFLMVFIALPALQRSQRNTRRRQDMARILSAFNDYSSNNNGKMPLPADKTKKAGVTYGGSDDASLKEFMNRYIGDEKSEQRMDPDGTKYKLGFRPAPTKEASHGENKLNHTIYYFINASCSDTEGNVKPGKGEREIAIFYNLEGGAVYCGDNS